MQASLLPTTQTAVFLVNNKKYVSLASSNVAAHRLSLTRKYQAWRVPRMASITPFALPTLYRIETLELQLSPLGYCMRDDDPQSDLPS